MVDTSCKYMGLNLQSPLIMGSCGLTNTVDKVKQMESYGVGAVVLKSIFEEQITNEANQSLANVDLDTAFSNARDYISRYTKMASFEKYTKLISEVKKGVRIPVIASINCSSEGEWITYAKKVQDAGADALELNISALPANFDKTSSEIEDAHLRIIDKVKKELSIPLAVKTGSYYTALAKVLQTFTYAGADALVMFNRPFRPDIDVDKMHVTAANIRKEGDNFFKVLRWVSIMSSHVDCSLSATSGVVSGTDMVKMLLAGADSVQAATVFYNKGIEHIQTMLEELKEWMKKHNYTSIEDFKGKLNFKNVKDPNVYLRIQFMKYFAGIE